MLYSIPNVCLQIDWKSYNIFLQKKYIMVGRYQVSPQKPRCNWTRGLIIVYNPNTLHITVFIAKLLPESKGAFEEHIIPIAVKAPFSLLFLSQSARNHHGEQGERGVTSESRQRQEAGWEEAERQKSPLFWLSCGGWRENVRHRGERWLWEYHRLWAVRSWSFGSLSKKTAAAMKPSEGHQQCHEVLLSSGDGGAGCLFFNLACWLGWGVKTV